MKKKNINKQGCNLIKPDDFDDSEADDGARTLFPSDSGVSLGTGGGAKRKK